MMARVIVLAYGLLAYAAFFVSILWAIGFTESLVVAKTIDIGNAEGPIWLRIVINVVLLGAFAVQHTIMARPRFKAWFTRYVPTAAERSTFVLVASLLLILLMWLWRPITGWSLWHVEAAWARWALIGVSLVGWSTVFLGSFLIDHFDLFGLRQVWLNLRRREYHHPPFIERSLYKLVRHPLMVGFLIAFWATPDMTGGRLLFAGVTTAYVLFGITVEERDLVAFLGDDYREYRKRTPALLPFTKRSKPGAVASVPSGGGPQAG